MGIIFSRSIQAKTNTNAVRVLPRVQREAIRKDLEKIRESEKRILEQKHNQQNIVETNNKNKKQEIVGLNTQIRMLNEQKERLMKQVGPKEFTYYESINNLEKSINQVQKQIEKLEDEIQNNAKNEEINKLQDKYKDIGLQCTYQNATKKIGTGGEMLGEKTKYPYRVNSNLQLNTLYKIPVESIINKVEYYSQANDNENYKLDMYTKVRDFDDNTTVHNVDDDGNHTITAPIISIDIKRSGSIDFTTYDNEGNELENIHKDKFDIWN